MGLENGLEAVMWCRTQPPPGFPAVQVVSKECVLQAQLFYRKTLTGCNKESSLLHSNIRLKQSHIVVPPGDLSLDCLFLEAGL